MNYIKSTHFAQLVIFYKRKHQRSPISDNHRHVSVRAHLLQFSAAFLAVVGQITVANPIKNFFANNEFFRF